MIVLIAILLSVLILGLMYWSSQSRDASFQRKYEMVSDLRTLVTLCRQHRSASHHILQQNNPRSDEIDLIEQKMMSTCESVISQAHFDNKPIYRILQSKLKKLVSEWETLTVSQNQMSHGRAIRHCLFLIDEVVLAWLIEAQKTELSDEYNLKWQQIIDSLEALTQFRLTIQDADDKNGFSRLQLHSATVTRRLNQLALISPIAVASPACSLVCKQLEELSDSAELDFTNDQLYKMSTDASLVIFNCYDCILTELAENIYEPLPKLVLSI
ncbi:hypothetical protein [Vibrio sp. MA40-2]|uniref:hypothetical protein n=1 Tax=Vibrio sp. MA40-2 TaxID=3391828 RepID=UPI0039A41E6E